MSHCVTLADIARQIRGVTYSGHEASYEPRDGYLPLLRANNITDEGISTSDVLYVPRERISAAQLMQRGDILVATSSGSLSVVGKAARFESDQQLSFGAFCKVVRPTDKVHPGYLSHFFQTESYRRRVSSLAAGVNINNLRNEHLDGLELRLPSRPEQKRIAAILDKVDAIRARRRAALADADLLLQATFIDLFGNPVSNPKGWDTCTIGQLISDGPQNGLYRPSSDYGSGTPILRIDSFYDGRTSALSSLKRVRIDENDAAHWALRVDDIVINRVNSIEYIGKSAIIPPLAEPTVFESNMMRFGVDRSKVEPGFVIDQLQTDYVRRQILKLARPAVNQSSINQEDVRSIRLRVPPVQLQRKYVELARRVDDLAGRLRHNLADADDLYASLAQRAFRGEL